MNCKSWRLILFATLSQPNAPRVLTAQSIYQLARRYGVSLRDGDLRSSIESAISLNLLSQVTEFVYRNEQSSPPVTNAEAATQIFPGAIVSLETALSEFGIIDRPATTVTTVHPASFEDRMHDEAITIGRMPKFRSYGLPARFFPPTLTDLGHVMTKDRMYKCFTPEKSLLDWIFLGSLMQPTLSPIPLQINVAAFNMSTLFRLADRMNIRNLLDSYLSMGYALRYAGDSPPNDAAEQLRLCKKPRNIELSDEVTNRISIRKEGESDDNAY